MNNKEPSPLLSGGASRLTAKAVIADKIKRHRKAADDLSLLLDALPESLTKEQDDAIWSIVCKLPHA